MSQIFFIAVLLSGFGCGAMQDQGTQTPLVDLELGVISSTNIPSSVSRDLGLTREDIEKLSLEAQNRWTRKKALTALTLMGTGASIATMLFVKFYDV
jgi:hypothetical protein